MRNISAALNFEQRKATRKPLIKLEVATYGHPAAVAATDLQFQSFLWERLTSISDATPAGIHSLAVPGDGSVCRLRVASSTLYYQRVISPSSSSDWSTWSNFGSVVAGPFAMAAQGAHVVVFAGGPATIGRRESSDYGATWGNWISMNTPPCERGCAAAFKSNGDLGAVHASDVNDPTSLWFEKRVNGIWSFTQIDGDYSISALAMYHDGDWNILALMLDGTNIRLARGIYGDGDQYAVGVFSGFQFINSYKAMVDFSAQISMRQFQTGRAGKYIPTYYEQVSAVNQARAVDNLAVDDPFICYHASLGAVYSFTKDNAPWLYRLRPGTEFKDMDWYKAFPLDVIATYGLALACDNTYLYAAAPNQVWRTALPGSWAPPAAGSGSGTAFSIPAVHVMAVKERVEAQASGSLTVILDNSKGSYNTIGSGSASLLASFKRGSEVTLSIGYRGSTDLLSVAGKYYIEGLGYSRKPGESLFVIRCIDAWGLLERYGFNKPVEWNSAASDFTVYDLMVKVVAAVGGALSVVSQSSYLASIYPHLSVNAGENGAVVLRNLLSLVPDVIYFVGLHGYIVYPQANDSPSYYLRFPK